MFFTSLEFLFLFLPITWLGFACLGRQRRAMAAGWWLSAASAVFYALLDLRHLPHLAAIIGVNYLLCLAIRHFRHRDGPWSRFSLWAGVSFDIGFLLWFKYFNAGDESAGASIPLGISFYTIQLVAFLVAVHHEEGGDMPLGRVVLFASFFPYVVAGPVVNRSEVFEQLDRVSLRSAMPLLLPALTLFAMGLFKKVVIADQIGVHVDAVYGAAALRSSLSALDAWGAALLYTLQIYFDFSGYSDMAAGLAGMFGLRLPRNFHSPLQATSIMEFWRRWHMSATRFFTNHFYLPVVVKAMRLAVRWRLQGVARFLFTVVAPMLVTFFLIGIWHGAAMTAVAFGLLMGVAISINHVWVKFEWPALPRWAAWLLTMLVVVAGMVFSRADTLAIAFQVFTGMAGLNSEADSLLDPLLVIAWLVTLWAAVLLLPNSNQVLERYPVVLPESWDAVAPWQRPITWHYGIRGALVTSLILGVSAAWIPKAAQFIYYRF